MKRRLTGADVPTAKIYIDRTLGLVYQGWVIPDPNDPLAIGAFSVWMLSNCSLPWEFLDGGVIAVNKSAVGGKRLHTYRPGDWVGARKSQGPEGRRGMPHHIITIFMEANAFADSTIEEVSEDDLPQVVNVDRVRTAFEAWQESLLRTDPLRCEKNLKRRTGDHKTGEYVCLRTERLWTAWQAAWIARGEQ